MASGPVVKGSPSPSSQWGTLNKNKLSPRPEASKPNHGQHQPMLFGAMPQKSEPLFQDTFTKTSEQNTQEPDRDRSLEITQSQRAALYWDAFKGHPEALAQRVMKRHQQEIKQWKQHRELEALETWMKDS